MSSTDDAQDFALNVLAKVKARNEKRKALAMRQDENNPIPPPDNTIDEMITKISKSTPMKPVTVNETDNKTEEVEKEQAIEVKPVESQALPKPSRNVRFQTEVEEEDGSKKPLADETAEVDEEEEDEEESEPTTMVEEKETGEAENGVKNPRKGEDEEMDISQEGEEEVNDNTTQESGSSTSSSPTKGASSSENIGISFETKRNLTKLGQLYAASDKLNSPVRKHSELEKTLDPYVKEVSPQKDFNSLRRSRLNKLAQTINQWEEEVPPASSNTLKISSPKKSYRSSPYRKNSTSSNSTASSCKSDVFDGKLLDSKPLGIDEVKAKLRPIHSSPPPCIQLPTDSEERSEPKECGEEEEAQPTETIAQKRARFEMMRQSRERDDREPEHPNPTPTLPGRSKLASTISAWEDKIRSTQKPQMGGGKFKMPTDSPKKMVRPTPYTTNKTNKAEEVEKEQAMVVKPVLESQTLPKPSRNPHYRPSISISASFACNQIDQYIGDALEGQDFTLDTINESKMRLMPHASSTPFNSPGSVAEADNNSGNSGDANTSYNWQKDIDITGLMDGAATASPKTPYRGAFAKSNYPSPFEERTPRPICFDSPKEPLGTSSPLIREPKYIETVIERKEDAEESIGEIEEDEDIKEEEEGEKFEFEDEEELEKPQEPSAMLLPPEEFKEQGEEQMDVEENELAVETPPSQCYRDKNISETESPLLHTVSFYRKQNSKNTPSTAGATPKRLLKAMFEGEGTLKEEGEEEKEEEKPNHTELIKKLEEEASVQAKSIAQASKAMDLCQSTMEFSNSTENVECEKILLISTQKRISILNEIHRLRTDAALFENALLSPTKRDLGPSSRGNMTLSDIAVELKRDFIGRAMRGENVFHFICLVRYRSHFDYSALVSLGSGLSSSNIVDGVLHFPNVFNIKNMEPDFKVVLDIYALQTAKEFLPHEAKYHINKKDSKGKIMTPKKPKKESKLIRPFMSSSASPANFDTIRTSNFTFCGTMTIDLSTLKRSHWTLEKVVYTSPLERSLSLKIECSAIGGVDERGFLTFFEDVSGLGIWNRRWCKLGSSEMEFWMYPEDENQKTPLGTIQLRQCVTPRVEPISREINARANTFMLITTHNPKKGDKESLVCSTKNPDFTVIRHMLAADTREDRDRWCKSFNKALTNLRAWDPASKTPDYSIN